jgi:hypothetical protein
MAGTYLAGKGGHVVLTPATTVAFRSWKVSMKAVGLKINDFTCQGFQTLIVGFFSASLTLDGAYFAGATGLTVGNVYTFELGYSASLLLDLQALVTDITPTVDAEKEETLSVTADSTGPFTASVT